MVIYSVPCRALFCKDFGDLVSTFHYQQSVRIHLDVSADATTQKPSINVIDFNGVVVAYSTVHHLYQSIADLHGQKVGVICHYIVDSTIEVLFVHKFESLANPFLQVLRVVPHVDVRSAQVAVATTKSVFRICSYLITLRLWREPSV